jgi:hypothetical protein
MASLSANERDCLGRYLGLLLERLGDRLTRVQMFGSAARGDVAESEREDLLNETYPLYLECGRQLSPHFFSERRLARPESKRTREFLARIGPEAVTVWPR